MPVAVAAAKPQFALFIRSSGFESIEQTETRIRRSVMMVRSHESGSRVIMPPRPKPVRFGEREALCVRDHDFGNGVRRSIALIHVANIGNDAGMFAHEVVTKIVRSHLEERRPGNEARKKRKSA